MNTYDLIKFYQRRSICNAKVNAKIDQQSIVNSTSKVHALINSVVSETRPVNTEYTVIELADNVVRISNQQMYDVLDNPDGEHVFLQTLNPDGTSSSSRYYTRSEIGDALEEEFALALIEGEMALSLLSTGLKNDVASVKSVLVSKISSYTNSVANSVANIVELAATQFDKCEDYVNYLWSIILPKPQEDQVFRPTTLGDFTGRSGLLLWAIDVYPSISEFASNFWKFTSNLFIQLFTTFALGSVNVFEGVRDAGYWIAEQAYVMLGGNTGVIGTGGNEDSSYGNGYIQLGTVASTALITKLDSVINLSVGRALILPTLGATYYVIKLGDGEYELGMKKHAYEWFTAGRTIAILATSGNTCADVVQVIDKCPQYNQLRSFETGVFNNDYFDIVSQFEVPDVPPPVAGNEDKSFSSWMGAARRSLFYSERLIGMGLALLQGGDINERYLQDANSTTRTLYREMGYGDATFRLGYAENGWPQYDDSASVFVDEVTTLRTVSTLKSQLENGLNSYLSDMFAGQAPSLFMVSDTELSGGLELTDDATALEAVRTRWAMTGSAVAIAGIIAGAIIIAVKLRGATATAYRNWQLALFDSSVDDKQVRALGRKYKFLSYLSGVSLGSAATIANAQISKDSDQTLAEVSSSLESLPDDSEILANILHSIKGS